MSSLDQVKTIGVPILSAIGGAAVAIGYLQTDQLPQLTTALTQMWEGAVLIFKGGGTFLIVIGTVWAAYQRSKTSLAAAVESHPDMHVITTDPAVKEAVPAVTLKVEK